MTREDLSKLSREQLENLLLKCYETMDCRASDHKERAERNEHDDFLWGSHFTSYAALSTMCNFMRNTAYYEAGKNS